MKKCTNFKYYIKDNSNIPAKKMKLIENDSPVGDSKNCMYI